MQNPLRAIATRMKSVQVPTGSSNWSVGLMPRTNYDYETDIGQWNVEKSSIVGAVLGWIGRTFPEAPPSVERLVGSDWEKQLPHDMLSLIKRPNRWYSGVTLMTAIVPDFWIDGNAYWLIMRDRTRRPTSLWFIPAWMIEPKGAREVYNEEDFITHYEYNPYSGANIKLDPRDVVHFRHGIDPENPRKGRGKFKSLMREIFTDEEAANFTAALLHNMGVPGVVVSPSKDSSEYSPSPAEARAMKEYIRQNFNGDHRGEAMVFEGPITVSQFGFSPEQMNLRELRRIPEERISGVVGVAAIVAGLGAGLDRSTFANYAEAREASYEENIIPMQRFISADLDTQLLPEFEPNPDVVRVSFDTSNVRILQEDKNKESDRVISQWRGGIIQLSEARSKLGYDIEKEHDFYALPLNADFVPADQLAEYVAPKAPAPTPPAVTVAPVPQLPAPGQTAQDGQQPPEPGAAVPTQGGKARERAAAKAARAHSRFMLVIERRTAKVRSALQTSLTAGYAAIGLAAGNAYQTVAKRAGDITDDVLDNPSLLRVLEAQAAEFEKAVRDAYIEVAGIVYEETAIFLETELAFNLDDPEARSIIEKGGKRINSVDIGGGIRSDIMRAISEGQSAGEGPRQIAKRIRDEVGGTKKAETIARTEVKYAQNVSSISAYKKSEVVTGLLAFDNQTGYNDGDCTARDGKVYSFADAEEQTDAEHPNGTLSWAPYTGRG